MQEYCASSPTDYDQDPVIYCANCFSLKIKHEDTIDEDYCAECGCNDTRTSTIEEWEKLYEHRYGHKYTVKGTDPKKTWVFQMPISKLKMQIYECPAWKKFIKRLYPHFPGGYSKIDSIIILFDKLIKDNRLDDIRLLLLDYIKNSKNGRAEKESNKG